MKSLSIPSVRKAVYVLAHQLFTSFKTAGDEGSVRHKILLNFCPTLTQPSSWLPSFDSFIALALIFKKEVI
jgi:hypothetical protein